MDTALRWFVRAWIAFFLLVNLAALTGLFLGASSFWEGLSRVSDYYSPSNLGNWIIEIVLLSPAIGAQYWLTQRQRRRDAVIDAAQNYAVQMTNVSSSLSMEPTDVLKATRLLDSEPEIGEVLDVYGGFIAACDTSAVRDVRELPFPKERIEASLLRAISLFKKYPQLQAQCETVLWPLAFFQDGVDKPILSPVEAVNRKYKGTVLKELPMEEMYAVIDELAKAVATKATDQRWEQFEPKVKADLARLRQLVSARKAH
jgi:hypothetical protein